MKSRTYLLLLTAWMITLAVAGCGRASAPSEPTAPVAPITIPDDLTQIDVCAAIPTEDIEAIFGRKLVSAPEPFQYYETSGSGGCSYDAGKDSSGAANFGYVVFTPIEEYDNQPLYLDADVSGIGDEAYFNNGADARQLWVKIGDRVAFVVAFGDEPREEGAQALAKLIVAALQ